MRNFLFKRTKRSKNQPQDLAGDDMSDHPKALEASQCHAGTAQIGDDAPPTYSPNLIQDLSRRAFPVAIGSLDPKPWRGTGHPLASQARTIFLVHDSETLTETRWRSILRGLTAIISARREYGMEGFDLYFVHHRSGQASSPADGITAGGYHRIADAAKLNDIFAHAQIRERSSICSRLEEIAYAHIGLVKCCGLVPPINIVILTDSDDVSTDPLPYILQIATAVKRAQVPPHQVGIKVINIASKCPISPPQTRLDKSRIGHSDECVDIALFGSNPPSFIYRSLSRLFNACLDIVAPTTIHKRASAYHSN